MIAIIGGSGIYDPNLLKESKEHSLSTPYGKPSDKITTGLFKGKKIAILPRHGSKHTINPTNVNYRANIHALKELGVTHILAPSAVGSLQESYRPGDVVFTDQFIDRTTKRHQSFYEKDRVCHIGVAEPACPDLRSLLSSTARQLKLTYHSAGTCVVIEGPRFSTKAESNLYRSWGAHIIGMTMVPECVLAREAQLCYATIATVTDWDVWRSTHVSIEEVLTTMKANLSKVKLLLEHVIPAIPDKRDCDCKSALSNALI